MTVRIVGIGGSLSEGSSSELALRLCLAEAARLGAVTELLPARDLVLPPYAPTVPVKEAAALRLIDALEGADGLVLASPAYHGSVSGLIKNVLDYVEELRDSPRPYLEARAVGCVATATGHQAAAHTLTTLRTCVHSLRGWPTPLGVALVSEQSEFLPDGSYADPHTDSRLRTVAAQVVHFARLTRERPVDVSDLPYAAAVADQ